MLLTRPKPSSAPPARIESRWRSFSQIVEWSRSSKNTRVGSSRRHLKWTDRSCSRKPSSSCATSSTSAGMPEPIAATGLSLSSRRFDCLNTPRASSR